MKVEEGWEFKSIKENERKGKERKGKERRGKERKGKKRKGYIREGNRGKQNGIEDKRG